MIPSQLCPALFAKFDQRFQCPTRRGDFVQLLHRPDAVVLEQVEAVHAESLHALVDILPRLVAGALPRLSAEEHTLPNLRHPWGQSLHCDPVPRRDVDMVHAVTQDQLDRPVCGPLIVFLLPYCDGPERDHRAHVSRPSEPTLLHVDAPRWTYFRPPHSGGIINTIPNSHSLQCL